MTMGLRHAWDRLSIYLPVLLMGLLALGTWWLVRNAPQVQEPRPASAPRHEPDYVMKGFSIQSFDASGRPAKRGSGCHGPPLPRHRYPGN